MPESTCSRDPNSNDQCPVLKKYRFLLFTFVKIESLLRNTDYIALSPFFACYPFD